MGVIAIGCAPGTGITPPVFAHLAAASSAVESPSGRQVVLGQLFPGR